MTKREQARLQVLNSLLAERMNTDQAATLLGVSARHTRRLLAAYRESGAAVIAHGSRGRRPSNTTSDTVIAEVVHLARTRYQGANHTHLSELLRECEGMDIARNTFRAYWSEPVFSVLVAIVLRSTVFGGGACPERGD